MIKKKRPKIAIVDPNAEWRDRICGFLRGNGYECTSLADLDAAERALSRSPEFTLVFVDRREAEKRLEQLRSFADSEVYPNRYVIILFSSQLTIPHMDKFHRVGSYDSEDKPYDPSKFLRMVKRFRRELNDEDVQSKVTVPSVLNVNFGLTF